MNPATPTIPKMPLAAFAAHYGQSERRQMLIGVLTDEMRRITLREGRARCVVFGSLVNSDTPCPNDIDIIVSVSSHSMPVDWLGPTEVWHAFPVRMLPPSPPACAEAMLACFNEQLADGFSLEAGQCVELVF